MKRVKGMHAFISLLTDKIDKDTKQYTFLDSITHDRFTSKAATNERLYQFFDDALVEIRFRLTDIAFDSSILIASSKKLAFRSDTIMPFS